MCLKLAAFCLDWWAGRLGNSRGSSTADFRQNYACSSRELRKLSKASSSSSCRAACWERMMVKQKTIFGHTNLWAVKLWPDQKVIIGHCISQSLNRLAKICFPKGRKLLQSTASNVTRICRRIDQFSLCGFVVNLWPLLCVFAYSLSQFLPSQKGHFRDKDQQQNSEGA